jgi:hypothetical protein
MIHSLGSTANAAPRAVSQPTTFLLLTRHTQAFSFPEAMYAFAIHTKPFLAKQPRDPPTSVARMISCEFQHPR